VPQESFRKPASRSDRILGERSSWPFQSPAWCHRRARPDADRWLGTAWGRGGRRPAQVPPMALANVPGAWWSAYCPTW